MDDWMKTCYYCRFFNLKEECCTKEVFEINLENNIDKIIEDGLIEEAIREGFSEKVFNSISKRKDKQQEFAEEFEQMKANWIEEISDQVARMLRNNFDQDYMVMPINSREFYCSQWD